MIRAEKYTADQMTPKERKQATEEKSSIDRLPVIPFIGEITGKLTGTTTDEFWHDAKKMAMSEIAAFNRLGHDELSCGPNTIGISEGLGAEICYPKEGMPYFSGRFLTDYKMLDQMEPLRTDSERMKFFREAGEQGRSKGSFISLIVCMIFIFVLLTALNYASVQITPNFFWYLFCGFCLALSVIAPGMSFSTLLMPLGLYTPFVDGIGHLDFSILIPGGIGALVTVICFAKAINALFDHYYSIAFHGIIGIVIAATVMIIPFSSFMTAGTAVVNGICLVAGVVIALLLDRFNSRVEVG